MKKQITVSAPGKLMLFGEHAVIYGHPCIVTAIDQRMFLTAEFLEIPEFQLEAPDVHVINYKKSISDLGRGDIPKGVKFVEIAFKNFIEKSPVLPDTPFNKGGWGDLKGIKITTRSDFSPELGFGSSAAATVCVVKALSELFELKLTEKQIFDLAYKTVLDIQGKGSGFDVASAVYGGLLYFVTGGRIIEPLALSNLPLVVGYSGVKADTTTFINSVKEKFANNKKELDEIYESIGILVNQAKSLLLQRDYKAIGELMNENQRYLLKLGVSTKKLDEMISAALKSGSDGSKLSGAGGGDCMIALAPGKNRLAVEAAIINAGGEIINVKANSEGVRVEL